MAAESTGALLELKGVSKAFSGHRVVSDVSFRIAAGEFVALLGANGAGKSTLIKILDGVYRLDSGEVWLGDQRLRATGWGGQKQIGVVHQDLGLIDQLSVAENLRLCMPPSYLFRPLLSLSAERRAVREALQTAGLDGLDPHRHVGDLSLGTKTLLAVTKQLSRGARVIIADETTSAMSSAEARWLVDRLRAYLSTGAAVVMVSHKLGEVVAAADRHLILRDGELVADLTRAEATRDRIAELIVGNALEARSGATAASTAGDVILTLDEARTRATGPVTLSVRAGEVVGVTGLTNSGLYDVALLAADMIPAVAGRVNRQPGSRVAFVPPDRDKEGVVTDLTVRENATLGVGQWTGFGGVVNLWAERRGVQAMLSDLRVVPPGAARRQGTLSGGNQQKVLIGRALLRQPQVLVLCEPTRGVDISTRLQVHETILDARARGVGILLVSTDSDELIAVADNIHVMREGLICDVVAADQTDPARLEALL